MRKLRLMIALAIMFFNTAPKVMGQEADRAQDEQAIRATAAAYQDAYNQGDAKTIAALWVENGEIIDQTGFLLRGRDVIQQAFAKFFEKNKGAKIEIDIQSIMFQQDDLAFETGTSKASAPDGQPPVSGRYSATHLKRDGKWLLLSVHEQPPLDSSNYGKLKDLEWLIGDWIDDQESLEPKDAPMIQITSYWSVNRNFIIRDFTATVGENVTNVGTQRIGWHAPSGQIRSWTFDSKGGIVDGTWQKNGDTWTVTSSEALPTGQLVTATESAFQNADGSQVWNVTNRAIDGKPLPDESFKLIRFQ